eukprot:NODE_8937_length_361_cov_145.496732.p4 GENE.NODE_8937_length_361_cov_145.496732~~NODE_8937_length_361_cov_145.496732.p4  ORF type:complete len:50 (-),score=22.57 NODE_8937_length_361_cov_145.496732:28-177(-)
MARCWLLVAGFHSVLSKGRAAIVARRTYRTLEKPKKKKKKKKHAVDAPV